MKKDNGIIFVAGIHIDELEKPPSQCEWSVNGIDNSEIVIKDYMSKVNLEMYSDFYHRNDTLRFNGTEFNINQLENYSSIGKHIVFISKSKKEAINRIVCLYLCSKETRLKSLEVSYYD